MWGKITDAENGEDLIGANVVLKQNGVFKSGTSTDFDGNYCLTIDSGTYDVEVSYIGFPVNRVTNVILIKQYANKLDVQMIGSNINAEELIDVEYIVSLMGYRQGCGIDKSQIRNVPTRNLDSLKARTACLSAADQGDNVSVRSGRNVQTSYYIDGKLVTGKLVSQSDIEKNRKLISNGTSAAFENNLISRFRPSFNSIQSRNSQFPNR